MIATVNLWDFSPIQLLQLHSAAADELQRRGLIRSANNPVGDLAEKLCCEALGWAIAPPSMPAADAVAENGIRYQIKARRLAVPSGSRQLGAIRNLNQNGFDNLAAILFDKNYQVLKAAIVPHEVIVARSRYQAHTNSSRFMMSDDVWCVEGVLDITSVLRTAAEAWGETGAQV